MVPVEVKTSAAAASLRSGELFGLRQRRSRSSNDPAARSAARADGGSRGISAIGTRPATRRNASALREYPSAVITSS